MGAKGQRPVLEYFVVADDGGLKRIPVSTVEGLRFQKAAVPELAGQTVKVVEVRKSTDDSGVPQQVDRVTGFFMKFDEHGNWDKEFEQSSIDMAFSALDVSLDEGDNKIVDLTEKKKKRKLNEKHRWQPNPAQLRVITNAALGHPRAVQNVKAKKLHEIGPPFSWKCEESYKRLNEHIFPITLTFHNLGENLLRELRAMIEHKMAAELSTQPIWQGIADYCKQLIVMHELRRSGEGKWYALVQIMKWSPDHVGEEIHEVHELCDTREMAVERVRALTTECLPRLKAGMSLESQVISELEYRIEYEG
jgi:hypothetical protein